MQEQNKEVLLSRWTVITDRGEQCLSDAEMEILMKAESNGARFVMFDGFMLNVAFVKEAYRKREKKDGKFFPVMDLDRKYIVNPVKELA